jgi:hypothetical protein
LAAIRDSQYLKKWEVEENRISSIQFQTHRVNVQVQDTQLADAGYDIDIV